MTVSRDGRIFVVESGDNAVGIYSPDFVRLATVKVGKKPIDIKLSGDERFAYVTTEKSNRVFFFEVSP